MLAKPAKPAKPAMLSEPTGDQCSYIIREIFANFTRRRPFLRRLLFAFNFRVERTNERTNETNNAKKKSQKRINAGKTRRDYGR